MADNNSSTQSNQNSGQGGGVFRDVNASIGGLELPISISPSIGNATSSAQSGDISVSGDVMSGGSHFGIGKILVLGAIAIGLLWVWRKK